LTRWFHDKLPGGAVSQPDKRDDTYLLQLADVTIGTKLREGNLEIKWRESATPFQHRSGISGQAERWLKWIWKDPNSIGPKDVSGPLAHPTGPWLTVPKERWQRKYRWSKSAFEPTNPKDIVELGAAVELTLLTLPQKPFATVLVESFAPDSSKQEQLLAEAVAHLWTDYPSPLPSAEQSYGYPDWLRRIVAR